MRVNYSLAIIYYLTAFSVLADGWSLLVMTWRDADVDHTPVTLRCR